MSRFPLLPVLAILITVMPDVSPAQDCVSYGELMTFTNIDECPGRVYGLDADGGFLFAACGNGGLWVLAPQPGAAPVAVAAVALPGVADDVAVADGYAYLSCGDAGLQVVDVSEPASPVPCGSLALNGSVHGVEFVGGRLYLYGDKKYCAPGSALQVVDVTVPTAPALVGEFPLGQDISDLAVVGDLVVAARTIYARYYFQPDYAECVSRSGYGVLDAGEPDAPAVLAQVDGDYYEYADCVASVGGLMYVGGRDRTLDILDLADPSAPLLLGSVDGVQGGVLTMSCLGDVLYLETDACAIEVWDVATAASPSLIAEYTLSHVYQGEDMAVVGTRLYLACGARGLVSVEVGNPSAPSLPAIDDVVLGHLPDVGPGPVAVAGNLAYTCDTEFRVIDVTDPAAPTVLASVPTLFTSSTSMAVDGNLVFVDGDAAPETDIAIFDVSDPGNPVLASYAAGNTSGAGPITADNGIAYLGRYGKVIVIDATDPTAPVRRADIAPGSMCYGVAARDGLLYAFASRSVGGYELYVIDVHDPRQPQVVSVTPASSGWEIVLQGNLALLYSSQGLCTVDISDPAAPVVLGESDLLGNCRGVAVVGNGFYRGDLTGFERYDFTVPGVPHLRNRLPCSITGLAVAPDFAVAVGNDGLRTLPLECGQTVANFVPEFAIASVDEGVMVSWRLADDRAEADLRLVAREPGGTRNIPVQRQAPGRYVGIDREAKPGVATTYLLSMRAGGGWTALGEQTYIETVPATRSRLVGARPNPFNPRVQVAFALAREGHVTLRVHDLQGRVVARLADARFTSGRNVVTWDGRDVEGRPAASGTYFVVLETAESRDACKITLVR